MTEHDKDNISQFFRKAAQEPQISFEESDWEKLEARLDTASTAGNSNHNRWKSAFIATVTLLFISVGLLLYISLKPEITSKKISQDGTMTVEESSAIVSSGKETGSGQEEKYVSKSQEIPKINKEITQTYPAPSAIIKRNKVPVSITGSVNEDNMLFPSTSNRERESISRAIEQSAFSKRVSEIDDTEKFSSPKMTSASIPADSSFEADEKDSLLDEEGNFMDPEVVPLSSATSRWNVMLSFSPDFSSTGMHRFTAPGKSFSVSVYHNLNKALSISVGATKSNKLYWDSGRAYHPVEEGFWGKKTNGVVPDKIEGYCSVLEIPIGVQYNIISNKKSNVYLAATLSSYFILSESYEYVFESPNPGAAESWQAKKTSRDLFSVSTVSASFERKISNRMMIGLSPYIKMPLSGIGAWADVKLYSMGAAFTLRYQFQKMKKPDRLIPAD